MIVANDYVKNVNSETMYREFENANDIIPPQPLFIVP